jgi:hypothetical protein
LLRADCERLPDRGAALAAADRLLTHKRGFYRRHFAQLKVLESVGIKRVALNPLKRIVMPRRMTKKKRSTLSGTTPVSCNQRRSQRS